MKRTLISFLNPLNLLVFLAIGFVSVSATVKLFAQDITLQEDPLPIVSQIEIRQGFEIIEDWNFVPESIRIEIFFSSRIPNSAVSAFREHAWLRSTSDQKPATGILNIHPSGYHLVWIPIGPLQQGEVYEIQPLPGMTLAPDFHSPSVARALEFRVQSAVMTKASGFQVRSNLALRETRSFQFTSIAFLDQSHAILTDSQSRILLLQLDPITGESQIPVEIAHLEGKVVQATAIKKISGSSDHELYFSAIPSEVYSKLSKTSASAPELLSGSGSLHRRRFHWDKSEEKAIRWIDEEVLLNGIPFTTSSAGPRPLTALALADNEVLLGLGPVSLISSSSSSSSSDQNNPQPETATDSDPLPNSSHPLESAILRIHAETKAEIQQALATSPPQLTTISRKCFLVTGIYQPTHLAINPALNLYLSSSYPHLQNSAITAPEGAGVPSIHYIPGAQLIRIDPGGFYGTPNQARSEFVAFGGNPKPSIDPWEQPEYPIGTFPLTNFQEEDLFSWGATKLPGAMLSLAAPHPLHDRFLVGFGLPSAPIEVITLKPFGSLLDRHALLDSGNRPVQFSYVRDMAQAPNSVRIYLITDGQVVTSEELQPGLWFIEPNP